MHYFFGTGPGLFASPLPLPFLFPQLSLDHLSCCAILFLKPGVYLVLFTALCEDALIIFNNVPCLVTV